MMPSNDLRVSGPWPRARDDDEACSQLGDVVDPVELLARLSDGLEVPEGEMPPSRNMLARVTMILPC